MRYKEFEESFIMLREILLLELRWSHGTVRQKNSGEQFVCETSGFLFPLMQMFVYLANFVRKIRNERSRPEAHSIHVVHRAVTTNAGNEERHHPRNNGRPRLGILGFHGPEGVDELPERSHMDRHDIRHVEVVLPRRLFQTLHIIEYF